MPQLGFSGYVGAHQAEDVEGMTRLREQCVRMLGVKVTLSPLHSAGS